MDIIMPQLGETVEEGTIAVWLKAAGDTVSKGDLLFEVETDKVTTEIPAPVGGVLAEIFVQEGETVAVGVRLATLLGEGEEHSADETENDAKTSTENVGGDAEPSAKVTVKMAPQSGAGRARLSPAVRRLMAENDLDLDKITGTGAAGRITRKDVETYLEAAGSASAVPVQAPLAENRDGVAIVPFNRVRVKTAEKMVAAKTTAPHVFQGTEVMFGNVDRVRQAKGAAWKKQHGFSLTYLPFIARATCMALREFDRLNAHLESDRMKLFSGVNLGIAVDMEFEGLIVPVIKNAERMTVAGLALAIRDLAQRARSNSLKPDELSGGTYTISNSGSFGTLFTAPIINLPQVAILSTDGVQKKPVVIEGPQGDSIAIQPVGVVAQSFDHRAIDGAYSAAYLRRVKQLLEQHDWEREI
ncbi:dihydrolipoamide acetyltransferase family protein [Emcibacter sp.]|uniref:dihydrolipoamide acetyltransferase family protein n=1 Tax=Emcibacter sp. TaxID=1979954 RepID=UPI003A8D3E6D